MVIQNIVVKLVLSPSKCRSLKILNCNKCEFRELKKLMFRLISKIKIIYNNEFKKRRKKMLIKIFILIYGDNTVGQLKKLRKPGLILKLTKIVILEYH